MDGHRRAGRVGAETQLDANARKRLDERFSLSQADLAGQNAFFGFSAAGEPGTSDSTFHVDLGKAPEEEEVDGFTGLEGFAIDDDLKDDIDSKGDYYNDDDDAAVAELVAQLRQHRDEEERAEQRKREEAKAQDAVLKRADFPGSMQMNQRSQRVQQYGGRNVIPGVMVLDPITGLPVPAQSVSNGAPVPTQIVPAQPSGMASRPVQQPTSRLPPGLSQIPVPIPGSRGIAPIHVSMMSPPPAMMVHGHMTTNGRPAVGSGTPAPQVVSASDLEAGMMAMAMNGIQEQQKNEEGTLTEDQLIHELMNERKEAELRTKESVKEQQVYLLRRNREAEAASRSQEQKRPPAWDNGARDRDRDHPRDRDRERRGSMRGRDDETKKLPPPFQPLLPTTVGNYPQLALVPPSILERHFMKSLGEPLPPVLRNALTGPTMKEGSSQSEFLADSKQDLPLLAYLDRSTTEKLFPGEQASASVGRSRLSMNEREQNMVVRSNLQQIERMKPTSDDYYYRVMKEKAEHGDYSMKVLPDLSPAEYIQQVAVRVVRRGDVRASANQKHTTYDRKPSKKKSKEEPRKKKEKGETVSFFEGALGMPVGGTSRAPRASITFEKQQEIKSKLAKGMRSVMSVTAIRREWGSEQSPFSRQPWVLILIESCYDSLIGVERARETLRKREEGAAVAEGEKSNDELVGESESLVLEVFDRLQIHAQPKERIPLSEISYLFFTEDETFVRVLSHPKGRFLFARLVPILDSDCVVSFMVAYLRNMVVHIAIAAEQESSSTDAMLRSIVQRLLVIDVKIATTVLVLFISSIRVTDDPLHTAQILVGVMRTKVGSIVVQVLLRRIHERLSLVDDSDCRSTISLILSTLREYVGFLLYVEPSEEGRLEENIDHVFELLTILLILAGPQERAELRGEILTSFHESFEQSAAAQQLLQACGEVLK